jgi:hypothetical protein
LWIGAKTIVNAFCFSPFHFFLPPGAYNWALKAEIRGGRSAKRIIQFRHMHTYITIYYICNFLFLSCFFAVLRV